MAAPAKGPRLGGSSAHELAILRNLSKDPAQRSISAAEFARELKALSREERVRR